SGEYGSDDQYFDGFDGRSTGRRQPGHPDTAGPGSYFTVHRRVVDLGRRSQRHCGNLILRTLGGIDPAYPPESARRYSFDQSSCSRPESAGARADLSTDCRWRWFPDGDYLHQSRNGSCIRNSAEQVQLRKKEPQEAHVLIALLVVPFLLPSLPK